MSKIAIVTGAGSGVGQAVALQLAKEGWSVGLLGRRGDALQKTVQLAGDAGMRMLAVPGDVSDADKVADATKAVERQFGSVGLLVAAAGGNIPRRGWDVLGVQDFRAVIDANLTGVFNCV